MPRQVPIELWYAFGFFERGTMAARLYGIPSCDTVKKARAWLDQAGLAYEFIDLRQPPIAPAQVAKWYEALGATLVNSRSTTYRQLSPAERDQIAQGDSLGVLQRHPTLIKRPVLEVGQAIYCGFVAATYQSVFSQN